MLVLTRATGERLIIGNGEVRLHVLEVRGNQVRIGIDAPRHISVHREEIFHRINNTSQLSELDPEETPSDVEG
ncbi:MAG: carbon storage regulator CsrA [Proteobacteria bacterium]|nr:carbon storage regulator CsrA [Pseudomonadota bacterium]